jgi:hypothetical protein
MSLNNIVIVPAGNSPIPRLSGSLVRVSENLVDELFGPGDPYGGADAGFQGQAGLGAFGGLTGAAKAPGQPGQQAVDSASAVEPDADDGKLARVRCELVIQPLGVGAPSAMATWAQ